MTAIAYLGVDFTRHYVETRRFFAARDKQSQVIEQLERFAPATWRENKWHNAVITIGNVWGNTIYMPYSASPAEMERLQLRLDQILAETTADYATESIDRIYTLLLEVDGANQEFIRRYRDAYRNQVAAHR